MRVDKRSSVPLYAQLKQLLAERIEQGIYKAGEKIPTELALCAELELSRPTVRQAIAELVAEGILVIKKGKGTFVCAEAPRVVLDDFDGYRFSFLAGAQPREDDFLDYTRNDQPPAEIGRLFGQESAPPCYELAWIHKGPAAEGEENGSTLAFCVSYIPRSMFPDLDKDVRFGKSMRDIATNRYAFLPQRSSYQIFVRPADGEEARVLDISKGSPVLVCRSVLTARNGKICEVNVTVMRYEYIVLNFDGMNPSLVP